MFPTPPIPPQTQTTLSEHVIHYPDSDGKPMAENDAQYYCITDTRFALEQYFAEHPQVYLAADLLIYYRFGVPTRSVAPHIFVVFGIPKEYRRSYKIWEEGKAPDVVFEFASESTWEDDLASKRGLYLAMGVKEYILFDPTGNYFDPILQGYFLDRDSLIRIPTIPESERGMFGIYSQKLNLELWAQPHNALENQYRIRLLNPIAGECYAPLTKQSLPAKRQKIGQTLPKPNSPNYKQS